MMHSLYVVSHALLVELDTSHIPMLNELFL